MSNHDIIRHEDIDVTNEKSVDAVRMLLHAFSTNLPDQYASQVREFEIALGVPALAPDTQGATNVVSSINGVPTYAIANTTKEEYEGIHTDELQVSGIRDKARASVPYWDNLPVEARQEFYKILYQEVAPNYEKALNLAIAVDVGKPVVAGSEYAKLVDWFKWAASEEVGAFLNGFYMMDDQNRVFGIDNIPDDSKVINFYQGPRVHGSGIAADTVAANYPAALGGQGDIAPVLGDSLITKAVAKAPAPPFIIKRMAHEALDIMSERFAGYDWKDEALAAEFTATDAQNKTTTVKGVDVSDPQTLETLKGGFGIITGRQVIKQWSKDANTFRIVGSSNAGHAYIKDRMNVDPNLSHTIFELGGNNPMVVMPSAADRLEKIVAENAAGAKSNAGQRCTRPGRWIVHQDVYEAVKELAIAEFTKSDNNNDNAVGNPLDPATKVGSLDPRGFTDAQEFKRQAMSLGATVIGGQRILEDKFPDAFYMAPMLVIWDKVPENLQEIVHSQEVFASIVNLMPANSLEHAIAQVNKSPQRLASSFNGTDDEFARFKANTKMGTYNHNAPPKDDSPSKAHAGEDEGGFGVTGTTQSLLQYVKNTDRESVQPIRTLTASPDQKFVDKLEAKKIALELAQQGRVA